MPLTVSPDTEPSGGHYVPTGKRRKRKNQDPNWRAVIWPGETGPKAPERVPALEVAEAGQTAEAPSPAKPRPVFTPQRSLAEALAGKPDLKLDAATRQQIDDYKRRLRQEIDDEEALLMLGAFD